jgi:hypothetical protein
MYNTGAQVLGVLTARAARQPFGEARRPQASRALTGPRRDECRHLGRLETPTELYAR